MMGPQLEKTREETKAEEQCTHHWIIESPTGPTSRGVCKYCGAEREFANYWGDFYWEDDISSLASILSRDELETIHAEDEQS